MVKNCAKILNEVNPRSHKVKDNFEISTIVDNFQSSLAPMQENSCLKLPQISNQLWCLKNEQHLNID